MPGTAPTLARARQTTPHGAHRLHPAAGGQRTLPSARHVPARPPGVPSLRHRTARGRSRTPRRPSRGRRVHPVRRQCRSAVPASPCRRCPASPPAVRRCGAAPAGGSGAAGGSETGAAPRSPAVPTAAASQAARAAAPAAACLRRPGPGAAGQPRPGPHPAANPRPVRRQRGTGDPRASASPANAPHRERSRRARSAAFHRHARPAPRQARYLARYHAYGRARPADRAASFPNDPRARPRSHPPPAGGSEPCATRAKSRQAGREAQRVRSVGGDVATRWPRRPAADPGPVQRRSKQGPRPPPCQPAGCPRWPEVPRPNHARTTGRATRAKWRHCPIHPPRSCARRTVVWSWRHEGTAASAPPARTATPGRAAGRGAFRARSTGQADPASSDRQRRGNARRRRCRSKARNECAARG